MAKKTNFLLPLAVANKLCADPQLARKHKLQITHPIVIAHTTRRFLTKCVRCEIPTVNFDVFLAETSLKSLDIGVVELSPDDPKKLDVDVLYGYEVDAGSINLTIDVDDDGKPFLINHPQVVEAIGSVTKHFMECTGLTVRVHIVETPVYKPPPSTHDADLHIVLGSSPCGETNIIEVQELCGLQLHKKRHWYRINGPTSGRGCVITDEDSVDNLQIVGNVVYLFTPRINSETEWIFTTEGGDLFAKQVRLASAALAKGFDPLAEHLIDTDEEFGELVGLRLTAELKVCKEKMADADKRATDALEAYREALYEKRAYLHLAESLKTEMTETRERLLAAFQTIRGMPLTHRIITTGDNAMHVETRRIIGRVGDKRYDYGSFVIRWSPGGKISIWPLVTTHPKGVPHPHIGIAGNICFGNVAPVIEQAFQEMRPGDGFATLFDWLVDGYDENLAEHKADEWSEITEFTI